MSETLLGVIIGGLIASLTPIVTIINNHIKWKKEQKIEYLKLKRDRLEKMFDEAYEEILKGINEKSYSMDALTDFDFMLPSKVSEEFEKFMMLETTEPKEIRFALYNILRSMKKELAEIEEKIESEIS